MKKSIPFISTPAFGLFGGLFVECIMIILSIVTSPFSDPFESTFLLVCCLIAVLSALFTVGTLVVNIMYLINLDDKRKMKITVTAEVCVGILLLFIYWSLWSYIINGLYNLF